MLSPHIPLHARVDARDELGAFADRFLEELRSVREHGSYDLDIATRQPAIAASVRRWHEEVPTVELRRVGSLPASPPSPSDADWIVVVPDDARAILWRHREDVLDTVTVSRMEGEFRAFLGDLLQRGRRIQDARILAPEEEAWVRAYSSGPDIPYEYDRCVHELFEAQVTRDPEAAALVFRDDVLSYATLNARANDVAHRLIGQGIGPGALVGVLTERSPAMIAAMMGVLKAGAAYVPLDPTYPKDRLAYMAQARWPCCSGHLPSRVSRKRSNAPWPAVRQRQPHPPAVPRRMRRTRVDAARQRRPEAPLQIAP